MIVISVFHTARSYGLAILSVMNRSNPWRDPAIATTPNTIHGAEDDRVGRGRGSDDQQCRRPGRPRPSGSSREPIQRRLDDEGTPPFPARLGDEGDLPASRGSWLEYSFLEWWCLGILMTAAACAVLALAGAIWQGRFLRITMRDLMGIVAIAGVLSAGVSNLMQRSRYLERVALDHLRERKTIILSDLETYLILTEAQFGQRAPEESEASREASVAAYMDKNNKMKSAFDPMAQYINYHERLSEKYKHAAARPWFPVAARPPEPPCLL